MNARDPFAPAALRLVPESLGESHVYDRPAPGVGNVLGLDVATSMGFALRTPTCVASGVRSWTERKGETRGDRLLRFQRWLSLIHNATPLALVAYELVQFMGTNQRLAAHCYAQFEGVLLTWAARRAIPVRSIHTGTLKKAIAGSGRTDKDGMIAAVRALGFDGVERHDEADALAVLTWAIR